MKMRKFRSELRQQLEASRPLPRVRKLDYFQLWNRRIFNMSSKIAGEKQYHCPTCNCMARVVPYSATPDPVEGHRHSERVPCLECKGTGFITEFDVLRYYENDCICFEELWADFNRRRDLLNKILAKIPQDVLESLREFVQVCKAVKQDKRKILPTAKVKSKLVKPT